MTPDNTVANLMVFLSGILTDEQLLELVDAIVLSLQKVETAEDAPKPNVGA